MTPRRKSTAARKRRKAAQYWCCRADRRLAADRGDEIAHLVDEARKPLQALTVVGIVLDGLGAVGDRERADAARRALQRVRQRRRSLTSAWSDLVADGQSPAATNRSSTSRSSSRSPMVWRARCARSMGRAWPDDGRNFAARHRKCHDVILVDGSQGNLRNTSRTPAARIGRFTWTSGLIGRTPQLRRKSAEIMVDVNLMFKLLRIRRFPCFLYQSVSVRYGGSIFKPPARTA